MRPPGGGGGASRGRRRWRRSYGECSSFCHHASSDCSLLPRSRGWCRCQRVVQRTRTLPLLGRLGLERRPASVWEVMRLVLLPVPSRGSSSILPSSRARMLVLAKTARPSDQPAERCIPLAGAGGRSLSRDTRAAHQPLATALAFASSMALVSDQTPAEQMAHSSLLSLTLTRGCR